MSRCFRGSATASELARLLASADALVHGCEAETFCMVAAEARASGIPLIVPDRGAAIDQLAPGAGHDLPGRVRRCRWSARSAGSSSAVPNCSARPPSASVRVRTMDEHFADLFARYQESRAASTSGLAAQPYPLGELALAALRPRFRFTIDGLRPARRIGHKQRMTVDRDVLESIARSPIAMVVTNPRRRTTPSRSRTKRSAR